MFKETLRKPLVQTVSQPTKTAKNVFNFSKTRLLIGFSLILGISLLIYAVFPAPKSQEDQLTDLINRIEGGEDLPSGELKDYCHLMAVLRDSISPQCVCILDGINWDNPPKSPEKLPDVWEEYKNAKDEGNRRFFKNKMYPKIKIDFDATDSNGNDKPHWHRENPNKRKKKLQYLDKDCNPLDRHKSETHIYTRK